MTKIILITGSNGLIGSQLVSKFASEYDQVLGVDNNSRMDFFGNEGDTRLVLKDLQRNHPNYLNIELDIRDFDGVIKIFKDYPIAAVVHCAAQPSHDLAAKIPHIDFQVNALGTLNLLEALRQFRPEAPFIFLSTNKVYGDLPNHLPLVELETRYEYAREEDQNGVSESMSIDQCLHSLFGVSKASADLLVQEYGKNFGLKTTCLRGDRKSTRLNSSHSSVSRMPSSA